MTRQTWWVWLPLAGGAALAVILQLLAGGRRVYLEVAPALLAVIAGVLATAVALAVTRTRQVRRRREAAAVDATRAEAVQARRRFVQRLDHELKNPLTALLAAFGGSNEPMPPEVQRHAQRQAERLRRLLTDLRRVADVETVALDIGPVDISHVVHEAVAWATTDAGGNRQVHIDVPNAPRPLPTIAGDHDLLTVAVYNVVLNALKYSAPGDAVEVRAREIDGHRPAVFVEVADAGPGIAPDEISFVWEELARGRGAATQPGSGIGLALVRVIVQRHHGSVHMSSRPRGGTTVSITLL